MNAETPKQIYNRLSKVYDDSYNDPIHRIEDDFVYKYLVDKGFTKGKILDIGSGTGSLLDNTSISTDYYTGLDISEKMIDLSSTKHPDYKFVKGTMSNMPFENESFDNVLSLFGSFSYTFDCVKTVQEINRVLKPGGRFFIMAYGDKYETRDSYILNKFNIETPATFFDKEDLTDLFEDFEDVKVFGMTWLSEFLSKHIPYPLAKAYHSLETKFLGRIIPDKFYFLIITGQKHA
jgi:ubiquinone/menaquinone biosynthesis C-methylase UbiE